MPARANVPKVVEIVMEQLLGSDTRIVNRFFQQYTGAAGTLSDGGAATWAAAVTAAWTAHMAAVVSSDLGVEFVTLTDLSTNIGGFGEDTTGAVGANGSSSCSGGVALVMKEHIERRYRGGHPRQYLAGVPFADLATKQTWTGAVITGWTTAYTAFRAAAAAGCPVGIGPAVDCSVSFYAGFTNHTFPSGRVRPIPTPRGTPLVDVISSFAVNPHSA
jgi:hypothetical protein